MISDALCSCSNQEQRMHLMFVRCKTILSRGFPTSASHSTIQHNNNTRGTLNFRSKPIEFAFCYHYSVDEYSHFLHRPLSSFSSFSSLRLSFRGLRPLSIFIRPSSSIQKKPILAASTIIWREMWT